MIFLASGFPQSYFSWDNERLDTLDTMDVFYFGLGSWSFHESSFPMGGSCSPMIRSCCRAEVRFCCPEQAESRCCCLTRMCTVFCLASRCLHLWFTRFILGFSDLLGRFSWFWAGFCWFYGYLFEAAALRPWQVGNDVGSRRFSGGGQCRSPSWFISPWHVGSTSRWEKDCTTNLHWGCFPVVSQFCWLHPESSFLVLSGLLVAHLLPSSVL